MLKTSYIFFFQFTRFLAILATPTALRLCISDVGLWKPSWAISDSSGLEGPLEFKCVWCVMLTGLSIEMHYNWVSGELEWPIPCALVPSEI